MLTKVQTDELLLHYFIGTTLIFCDVVLIRLMHGFLCCTLWKLSPIKKVVFIQHVTLKVSYDAGPNLTYQPKGQTITQYRAIIIKDQ